MGPQSLDLTGHVWTHWNAGQGQLGRSELVAWPHGVDLVPLLGGWLDILAGSLVVGVLGPVAAYNLVSALYLFVAGVGGWALARVAGANRWGAAAAGLLLQIDGYTVHHLLGGRTEQAGVGFVALALAAAWSLRAPGWRAVRTGLAGAVVVVVSWEHALLLAGILAWMVPWLRWDRARATGWAVAAATCALVVAPWAWVFLDRAMDIRLVDEGASTVDWAGNHAITLLPWLTDGQLRPSVLALLCLPVVRGRAWLGACVGLLVCVLLALGPTPGLRAAGDLGFTGPWVLFQHLPVVGWFHTPDRLLLALDLAAITAAGLVVTRARWLAPAALVALLAAGFVHQHRTAWPRGVWRAPVYPELRDLPGEGALLDLPVASPGLDAMRYQNLQLLHGRPIPHHMTLPHLTTDAPALLLEDLPALAALASRSPSSPIGGLDADLEALRERGYSWLVLHPRFVPVEERSARKRALRRLLGPPTLELDDHWIGWRLDAG